MIAAMDARTLTLFQTTFQPVLERTTHQFVIDTQTTLGDEELNQYIDQIEQLVVKGGKRARPYICALAYTTNGGKRLADIQNILVAIELFHVFGLIHDDIIDQGDKRHNQTTLHRFVADRYSNHTGDNEHRGTAQAILMGDIVYAWANRLVTQTCQNIDRATAQKLSDLWHEMSQSVLAGQMLDTASATRKSFAYELIMRTIELKTAAYSVVGPMKLGGTLAQAPDDFMMTAETFGKAFGIAYQLQDDLLDILHTEHTSDKTAGRDIGQHTFITDYIATHGTKDHQQKLRSIQNSTSPTCDQLRELVVESQTDKAIRLKINDYFAQGKRAITESNLTSTQQQPWLALIELLQDRDR
jgi:geranylgeranyl diphosphate synthase, type I